VGYTYTNTGEQPNLVANSQGETDYYPGDTFEMTVILANTAGDTAVQVAPRLAPGAYNPSTALGVMVRPGAGDAPVSLKSLPAVAGDIGSSDQVPVLIKGTIHRNASPGVYAIPLEVTYQYIYGIPTVGEGYGTIAPLYSKKEQVLPATFRVKSEVRPAIVSEKTENIIPGTQGYLTVVIANIGFGTGTDVTLRIVPSDNVTFQMVEDSVYLARLGPGDVVPLRVRIAVMDDTGAGSYPAVLEGKYRDADGTVRETTPVPLGIPVSRGAVMKAMTRNLTIGTGGEETITVSFLNAGNTPAYDATARIIGTYVLMPVDDSVSLGTINPGEIRTTQFVLSATNAMAGKRYVIDSEIKYRDELGALVLSDKMSVGVAIAQPSGISTITSNPAVMILIAGILGILAYGGWKMHGRKAGKK
jgi:hypothetical protein